MISFLIHSEFRIRSTTIALASLAALTLAGCNPKTLTGGVDIKNRTPQALESSKGPNTIHVCDFKLDPSLIKTDPTGNGLGSGILGSSGSGGGILGRLRQRTQPDIHGTPEEQALQIVNLLAQKTTDELLKLKRNSDRLGNCADTPAVSGWVVRGEFRNVDEGNRAERAAIGFGEGATHLDLNVQVQSRSEGAEAKPVEVFDTAKEPGKKPGAIVTLNPYVLAAKFHMEKNATEKDIQQTAEEIAKELDRLAQPREASAP